MDDTLKSIYGSYEVPKEIHLLHELEEKLNVEGLSLDIIGFRPVTDLFTYHITPPDLIPFAETGGAGIHFGFLTDFGRVQGLHDAPIVCVTPTNDPPIRYMARNINEFLNLVASVPHAEMLEAFWSYADETQIQEHIEEFQQDTPPDWAKNRQTVLNRFQETFGTQCEQIIPYLRGIQAEREKIIAVSTLDSLGVVGGNREETSRSFAFSNEPQLNDQELQRMQEFLNTANRLEKLVFIRDANYRYVIAPNYNEALLHLIIELLQSMNLHTEAQSVLARQ